MKKSAIVCCEEDRSFERLLACIVVVNRKFLEAPKVSSAKHGRSATAKEASFADE
jgi:hypothetical protein